MSMDVYCIITERIIAALDAGTVPWNRPWDAAAGAPRNAVSKKAYRGINVLAARGRIPEQLLAELQAGERDRWERPRR